MVAAPPRNTDRSDMRIAVVGSTGRIGATLTRRLLRDGHAVKALSRGGPALDALVALRAAPVLGSFDTGAGDLDTVFQDVDAAFLMVKTDWTNLHGHYPAVASRFVAALRNSPVRLAVSLTAIGSDAADATGHFEGFHHLDQTLNQLGNLDLVHLRAGWFMENALVWTSAVAQHGRIGWSLDPAVKLPWVATQDIADLAASELTNPTGEHRVIREVGSEDLAMPDVAAIISEAISKPIEYRFVDRTRDDVEAAYLARSGTPERWPYDSQTLDALNDRRVRFHGSRRPLATTMTAFVRDVWRPRYLEALAREPEAETFYTWCARD